jgi:hypothetical protein
MSTTHLHPSDFARDKNNTACSNCRSRHGRALINCAECEDECCDLCCGTVNINPLTKCVRCVAIARAELAHAAIATETGCTEEEVDVFPELQPILLRLRPLPEFVHFSETEVTYICQPQPLK